MFNSSLDVRRPLSRILVPTTPPLRRTSPSSQERCVVDPSILQRTVAASLPYICRIPNAAAVAASPSDQRLLSNLRVAPHLRSSAKEITYRTRKEKENVTFKNHVIQWFEVLAGLLGPNWKAIGLAFNCTFLLFGSVIQLIGCASNIYYINDHLDKRTWTYIFGACYATTMFIPSFQSYRIWSCTAWYLTIAAFPHGQMNSRGYIMGYYDDSIDKFFTD